jgi:hypothetical protein
MATSRRAASRLGGLLDQLNQPPETPMAGTPATQEAGLPDLHQPGQPAIQESRTPATRKAVKKVTFEFDAAFARALQVRCAAEGISMRDYVVRAIQYFQEARKPVNQD